jgi:hypothetical protein
MPDPQTAETTPRMGIRKAMIPPGSREAPKFSSKKPQELRRFLRQIEDSFAEAGITDDVEKKVSIGKYADQESEEEWKALETYDGDATWDEFKDELLENYPEAAAAERGTPARIRQVCKEANGISLGDLDALYAYRRTFLAEAVKLKKPPAVMSNRELVELFISGLSVPLAQTLLQYLGSTTAHDAKLKGKMKTEPGIVGRRPEDRYDLEEVCKAAIQVSSNAQGMLQLSGKWGKNDRREMTMVQTATGDDFSSKLESLEESQAIEKDRLTVINKQLDSKLDGLESLMKALMAQQQGTTAATYVQNFNPGGTGSGPAVTQQKWTKNPRGMECFGCGGDDHFQDRCEKIAHHLRLGNLKLNSERKVCLPDGSRVPNIPPGANLIERMERFYTNKPSQTYYGAFEDVEEKIGGTYHSYNESTSHDKDQRIAQLEKEFSTKKEILIRAKQLKLEKEAKEKSYANERESCILDLLEDCTEEELGRLKEARPGFL